MITANELSDKESLTESSPTPPSSGMFVSSYSPVQLTGTEDLSMWLQAAFPVNRFQSQVVSSELTTRETCGSQQSSAFASYDQDSHSWKTCQGWLLADISAPSFQTFARAGMTVGGEYYPQPKWERRTNGTDCGLRVPTPTVDDANNASRKSGAFQSLTRVIMHPTSTVSETWVDGAPSGSKLNPTWVEWLMGWVPG
jgi:hypothetical protein